MAHVYRCDSKAFHHPAQPRRPLYLCETQIQYLAGNTTTDRTWLHLLSSDLYNRLTNCTCVSHGIVFTWFLTATVFSSAGRWNATDKALVVRTSTTLPWIMVVSVHRLTLLRGRNPRLPTKLPSRPRAALHTCGGRTQTHTWPQSPCLDGRERSALRCDAGRYGRPGSPHITPTDK